jgi:hypothetical protein
MKLLPEYRAFLCPHCGLAQYCESSQKTHTCRNIHCAKRIDLSNVITLGRTNRILKAVKLVQDWKHQKSGVIVFDH